MRLRVGASLLCAVALIGEACAQRCGPLGCPAEMPAGLVMVRVSQASGGGRSAGTATLVRHGGARSYFLSCAHVFDGAGPIAVEVPGSEALGGRLVAVDRQHDLAVVETGRVQGEPVGLGAAASGVLTACGFGPLGRRRCVQGPLLGYATPRGAVHPSLRMRGAVRPGDSGGPVVDGAGRLVGVVWGARGGETYAVFGRPIAAVLARLPAPESRPAERNEAAGSPPFATPPAQGLPSVPALPSWLSELPPRVERGEQRLGAIEQRFDEALAGVERRLAGLVERRELESNASRTDQRYESLRERVERLIGVVGTVGSAVSGSGASGWGASGVGAMAGWLPVVGAAAPALAVGLLMGRGWRRWRRGRSRAGERAVEGRPIAVDTPPPPQRVAPETHYVPYATDDFAKAHQWAGEQLARKFPGSVEWLTSLDSLIRQQLAGRKESAVGTGR